MLDSSQEISVAKSMSLLRDYVARTVMLAEQASKKKATVKEQAAEKKVKEEIDPKFMANVTKQALAKMSKSLQQLGSELSTLSFIEGQQGVDCSRKSDFQLVLSQFQTVHRSLVDENNTKVKQDEQLRQDRDQKHAEYVSVQARLSTSTKRAEAASVALTDAVDDFQTLDEQTKSLRDQLSKDCDNSRDANARLARFRAQMDLVNATQKTLAAMSAAIDGGHDDVYRARLPEAQQAVDKMGLPDAVTKILQAEVASKVAPDQAAASLLDQVYENAAETLAQQARTCAATRKSLVSMEAKRRQRQLDIVTYTDEADEQKSLAREATSKIHGLAGEALAADETYENQHREFLISSERITRQAAALQEVIDRLSTGLAACP